MQNHGELQVQMRQVLNKSAYSAFCRVKIQAMLFCFFFCRHTIEEFSRIFVRPKSKSLHISLTQFIECCTLRQESSDKPVSILVTTTFKRGIRMCEVYICTFLLLAEYRLFYALKVLKLNAIIAGNALE